MPRPMPAILSLALVVTACAGSTSSPSATAVSSPTPTMSGTPAASSPAATSSAEPSDGAAGPFTCDLPIVEAGSVPIANIVDVRVGTHDGFDRLVFEFDQGTPELTLDRATPPFTQDASGMPLAVDGSSFLGLLMRGGTKQTDDGTSSYDGPTEFEADLPALVHAVEGGDFERQSTWYLGLDSEACVRVDLLDAPPRLVIDVEH